MRKTLLFIFLLTITVFDCFCQDNTPTKYLELGVSANSYKGDIQPSYQSWNGGFNIGILFNKKKRLNGHLNIMIGSVTAQSPDFHYDNGSTPSPTPNNFANTSIFCFNYDLHINLYKKYNLVVYLYQGIGLFRFNPKDSDGNNLTDQLNTRASNETYSNISICLPHGLGVMYTLKQGYGVGMQAGFINTFTDYLDNVSQWGNKSGNDNILSYKFTFYAPLSFKSKTPPAEQKSNLQ